MNEYPKDILFDIDMQLYDEFNDKIATMYDYLGEVYSQNDINEVLNAEKEKEIKLLREAIKKQSQQIEYLNCIVESDKDNYINKTNIEDKIKVLEVLQKEFPNNEEIRIRLICYKELLKEMINK